ncbi:hypothetical protein GE09DRAFT_1126947 [Coniochaeta sp. 2T2.1]|nr:hypothetical protein GE09DRAFT_1126947 [Coniochaeta sp. 2T2.1]
MLLYNFGAALLTSLTSRSASSTLSCLKALGFRRRPPRRRSTSWCHTLLCWNTVLFLWKNCTIARLQDYGTV